MNTLLEVKNLTVSFTSGYKKTLFNILDLMLVVIGVLALILIIPSNLIRSFSYNMLMTVPGTLFTAMYLNKVLAVNYTAFNYKDEKKLNFKKEEVINEAE